MQIRDVMSSPVATCSPAEPVAGALERMWTADCGLLPILDQGRVTGVVTDRDIAMALVLKGRPAARVAVREASPGRLHTCRPDDEVSEGLRLMAEHRVRRLPVVDGEELCGIVSLNDLVRAARAHHGAEGRPTYGDLVKTLRQICSSAVAD